MPYRRIVIWLGALLSVAAQSHAQDAATAGRRIADIAAIALAEYEEGVVDGVVVRPEEYEEARLFLGEASRTAETLPDSAYASVRETLAELSQLVGNLGDPSRLHDALNALRADLEERLGISLDPLPDEAPSLSSGAALYERQCAQCHGEVGGGAGPLAGGMDPPPADLTDTEALGGVSPVEFFRKINVGVAGTAMPGFENRLSLEERWAVALYASSLRGGEDLAVGRAALERTCSACGLLFSDLATTAHVSDDSLRTWIGAIAGSLTDEERSAAVSFARVASAREYWGGSRVLAIRRTIERAREALNEALSLARQGRAEDARRAALDAYLVFEGVESSIRAQDAGAVRRVEQAFGAFRASLADEDAGSAWTRAYDRVLASLDEVSEGAAREMAPSAFFFQSFVILLREGLEAILIVGALVAFLVRAGATERRRDVGLGTLWALGASVATAVVFATVARAAAAHQEVIEGLTMLLASAVLFVVSYWLVSKVELAKWNAFVRAKMQSALTSGRSWALAGVAFLAVYREGFETVLFYAALLATSEGQGAAIMATVGGFAAGVAVLAVVYVGIQRFGLRIPLRPFFAVTSALLYLMAFSFAGQGIAELQEVGWVALTPLQWIPSIPVLGIFPTIQTVLGQALLALALLGALAWVFVLQPRGAGVRASA